MKKNFGRRGRWALFVSTIAFSAMLIIAPQATKVQAQGTLKVGMTLADIPVSFGQPDQGFEGFRFMGLMLYDALINLSLIHISEPTRPY